MPQTSRNHYTRQKRKFPNLEQRRRRWYAVLAIPKDIREKIGKAQFVASLETDSLAKARERLPAKLTGWRLEIAQARGEPHDDDAAFYRRALAKAKTPEHRARVMDQIDDEAWDIASVNMDYNKHQRPSQVPEARDFFDRATGSKTEFTAHLDEWLAHSGVSDKTKDMSRSDVQRFAKSFPMVQDASRKEVQLYVRGLDLAPKTIKRILGALRGYWRYLQSIEVVPEDLLPFDRIELPKRRKSKGDDRLPFPSADIPKLLKAADGTLRDLIELAAYSGCRIEELCALKLDNVHKTHFAIIDSKTAAGVREVPIHPKIRKTVARLTKAKGDGYLLSGLTENKYGDRSNAIGKRFGRLKAKLGYGPRHVFHSIRKTVATALKEALIPEVVAADILGHEIETMSYGLYAGGVSLDVKAKALAQVKYPAKS